MVLLSAQSFLRILSVLAVTTTATTTGDKKTSMAGSSNPLAQPINQFTLDLFQRLSTVADQEQENAFLSPFSVSTALSMVLLAAKGRTSEQLIHGLHFDTMNADDRERIHNLFHDLLSQHFANSSAIHLANYALIQQEAAEQNDILPSFKQQLRQLYSAQLDDVDFANDAIEIMERVNLWVKDKTMGLISHILDSAPDPDTKMLLLNAIYFKGKWKSPFDGELTQKGTFMNFGRENQEEIDFMTMYDHRFPYMSRVVAGQETQVLRLPYMEGDLSMIVLLPKEADGVDAMVKAETFQSDVSEAVQQITSNGRFTGMNVILPKFKLESEYDLLPVLSDMGMGQMFGSAADLSGVTGRCDLLVSAIKHKAVVQVDEEGTEAAAVTAVGFRTLALTPTAYETLSMAASEAQ